MGWVEGTESECKQRDSRHFKRNKARRNSPRTWAMGRPPGLSWAAQVQPRNPVAPGVRAVRGSVGRAAGWATLSLLRIPAARRFRRGWAPMVSPQGRSRYLLAGLPGRDEHGPPPV